MSPIGKGRKVLSSDQARALIAGFVGSKIVNNSGQGLLLGAVVGGFLFNPFGGPGVSGLNLYSLLVAIVGAVVVLWLYHVVMGRRRVV